MSDNTEIRDLDAPPVNPLDSIFVLPDHLASDHQILEWYEEMVSQLRREAQGVPMKSGQYTLMERIAFFYANMRYQEFHHPEMSDRQRQANIDNWQKALDQFNRLLEKHNDKVVNEMLIKVHDILMNALPIVTDDKERANLRRHLQEQFANIDM